MEKVFLSILNLSITASYLIIAVLLLRLIFRKLPRKLTCVLWALVGIRLAIPFSFESILSLIPSAQTFDPEIIYSPAPVIKSGIPMIDATVNPVISENLAPITSESVPPMVTMTEIASVIWCAGLILILIYGTVSYLLVRRRVVGAVLLEDNIWQSEGAPTPFILGIIKPKIYIPFNIAGDSREYVISHEKAHLKRLDHLIKPIGFILLALYWFNPLVWIAYVLLCRDIELACDEKVIRNMNEASRRAYASALLSCSAGRRRLAACPLAFGEVGVKERVKGVMNYKKPAFWIIVIALILCVCTAVFFLTSPKDDIPPEQEKTVFGANSFERSTLVGAGSTYGIDVPVIVDDISVRSGTPRIDITLKNNSGMTLSHGSPYSIYYISDGEKTDCDHFAGERAWTSIAHMIMPGGTKEMGFTMDSHDLSKAGRYRFELEFWLGDDHETKYTAWAEFEIAEDLPAIKVSAKEYERTAADPVLEGEQYFKIIDSTTAELSDLPRELSFDMSVTGENKVKIALSEQMEINDTVTKEFELTTGEIQTVLTPESGGGVEYVFEITKMPESEMDGSDTPGYIKRLSDIPTYEEAVEAGVLDETEVYVHNLSVSTYWLEREFDYEVPVPEIDNSLPILVSDNYEDFKERVIENFSEREEFVEYLKEHFHPELFENKTVVLTVGSVQSGSLLNVDNILISGTSCMIAQNHVIRAGNCVSVSIVNLIVFDRELIKNCDSFNAYVAEQFHISEPGRTETHGDIYVEYFYTATKSSGLSYNDPKLWAHSETPDLCNIAQSPILYKIDSREEMETLKGTLSEFFTIDKPTNDSGFTIYYSLEEITDFPNLHYRDNTVFLILDPGENGGTRHLIDSVKVKDGKMTIGYNIMTMESEEPAKNRFILVSVPKEQTSSCTEFAAARMNYIDSEQLAYGTVDDYIILNNDSEALIYRGFEEGMVRFNRENDGHKVILTSEDGKESYTYTAGSQNDVVVALFNDSEWLDHFSVEWDLFKREYP